MASDEGDYNFKIVVVGASGTGVDFGHKSIEIDGKMVRAQIWDTAGQERFKAIMPKFYAGTHGALIVYSIVDRNSFESVRDWLDELRRQTDCKFIMLVGNKNDLESTRAVTKAEGQDFASKNDLLFMETSAKTAANVDEAFSAVIKEIFDDTTKPSFNDADDDHQDIAPTGGNTVVLTNDHLQQPPVGEGKRGCPC